MARMTLPDATIKLIRIPVEMMESVNTYRFATRHVSEASAIRHLIGVGLAAEEAARGKLLPADTVRGAKGGADV